jgi:hypothetical protein
MLREILRDVSSLNEFEIKKMFNLMDTYYKNLNFDKFYSDLMDKDQLFLGYGDDNEICGFTTFVIYQTIFNKEKINILFSGDTILNKKYWGKPILFKIFIKLLKEKILLYKNEKFYWFLISKGIRTYLILPLLFNNYYPNYNQKTPEYEYSLLKHLSLERFKDYFIEENGIIKLSTCSDFLKGIIADIPDNKKNNPDVQFFLDKNKNFRDGDELVCLAEIKINNLTKIAKRYLDS